MKLKISQKKLHKELLHFMNSEPWGAQVLAPFINHVILSQHGGDLYQFHLFTTGRKKNLQRKLEIHMMKEGILLLLINDEMSERLDKKARGEIEKNGENIDWWRNFESIEEFKKNFFIEAKEVLSSSKFVA